MSGDVRKCPVCNGLGYTRCDCWPGDCICGFGDETCEECFGSGEADPYDDCGHYDDEPEAPQPQSNGEGEL